MRFFKMTGSGNDFVFVDGREHPTESWSEAAIRSLCDRRTGVGGDGLVTLTPEGKGAARMVYFNADGSRAGMCGNAALCSTRLAVRLGMAAETGMELHTDTGVLQTRCVGPGWAAELRLCDFELPKPTGLVLEPGEQSMFLCTVGVSHVVAVVERIVEVDVEVRGKALRLDPAFAPGGTNVNFVGRTHADPEAGWQLRTYERGVEAETLACGTGTVGAAFCLAQAGLDRLPIRIRSWGGNVFSIAGRLEDGWAREPWLCGEGRLVFEGQLSARDLPA